MKAILTIFAMFATVLGVGHLMSTVIPVSFIVDVGRFVCDTTGMKFSSFEDIMFVLVYLIPTIVAMPFFVFFLKDGKREDESNYSKTQ